MSRLPWRRPATAPPGSAHSAATWQCKKVSAAAGATVIKWADGNANFDNTPGTDGASLAALSYQ